MADKTRIARFVGGSGSAAGTAKAPSGPVFAVADPELAAVSAAEVKREVSARVAERLRVSPLSDTRARRELTRSVLAEVLIERSRERIVAGAAPLSLAEEHSIAETVMDALFGAAFLQRYLDDDDVENIEVNGFDNVWISYADGREVRVPPIAKSDDELIELVQNLVSRTGQAERTFSTATPTVHITLDGGARLAAVAWVSPRPQIVIRRHRAVDVSLRDLQAWGSISHAAAELLSAAIRAGRNIIVTGVQNTGKTTMLRALAAEFPPVQRFATIEREYELLLQDLPEKHPRVVALEARVGSSERDASGRAAGELSMSQLLADALRLNVRRIIVGEVRGPEIVPMLHAMMVGDGSMCTIHVRSAETAIDRVVNMCLEHGQSMTEAFAYRSAAAGIDFVVHMGIDYGDDGRPRARYVTDILEIGGIGESGRPTTTQVFAPGPEGRAVPVHAPACLPELQRFGFDPALLNPMHIAPVRSQARRAAR